MVMEEGEPEKKATSPQEPRGRNKKSVMTALRHHVSARSSDGVVSLKIGTFEETVQLAAQALTCEPRRRVTPTANHRRVDRRWPAAPGRRRRMAEMTKLPKKTNLVSFRPHQQETKKSKSPLGVRFRHWFRLVLAAAGSTIQNAPGTHGTTLHRSWRSSHLCPVRKPQQANPAGSDPRRGTGCAGGANHFQNFELHSTAGQASFE